MYTHVYIGPVRSEEGALPPAGGRSALPNSTLSPQTAAPHRGDEYAVDS